MPDIEPLLTVAEVARRLNVTEGTVRKYIGERKIGAVLIGRNYRVSRENLQKYLAEREVDAVGGNISIN